MNWVENGKRLIRQSLSKESELFALQRVDFLNRLDEHVLRVQGVAYFGKAANAHLDGASASNGYELIIAGMVWKNLPNDKRLAIKEELFVNCKRFPGEDERKTKK